MGFTINIPLVECFSTGNLDIIVAKVLLEMEDIDNAVVTPLLEVLVEFKVISGWKYLTNRGDLLHPKGDCGDQPISCYIQDGVA